RIEITTSVGPFAMEFETALMILRFRNEADGPFTAAVSFNHSLDDPIEFERILGCPVTLSAPWSGISLPLEVWRLPLRRRDPILRQVLEGHADEILARLPARTGLALEVQRALASRVAGGDTRIESVGREFGMSARTLQRRLADEGLTYQRLLDDARKVAAPRHLAAAPPASGRVYPT